MKKGRTVTATLACDLCLAYLVKCPAARHGICCPKCGKYEWPAMHGAESYFDGFKGVTGGRVRHRGGY